MYTKFDKGDVLIVGVYVDDLLITGSNKNEVEEFKSQMNTQFEMSNLGLLSFYPGIEVNQTEEFTTLKQSAYARKLLEKSGISSCNPCKFPMEHKLQLDKDEGGTLVDATEYRGIVGSLRYLTHTRPDISYAVGIVSRFMEMPTVKHQQAIKHILRYIRGTIDYGLVYKREGNGKILLGFSDSDLAGDVVDRRSTGGMCFYLNHKLISWISQKQRVIALSSCEAEYMAATNAASQGIWFQSLLEEISGQRIGQLYYTWITSLQWS